MLVIPDAPNATPVDTASSALAGKAAVEDQAASFNAANRRTPVEAVAPDADEQPVDAVAAGNKL